MKLLKDFYLRDQVVEIARDLLGKVIYTNFNGELTAGVITETEAYAGAVDRASHAYGNLRTKRTETMFRSGGIAYIYLCYGVHHLFNFVTNVEGMPHAVLLRGIYPLFGQEKMVQRRGIGWWKKGFTNGPGKLSKALGINVRHNGTDLTGNTIWIEDDGHKIDSKHIYIGPRIGVDYAGKDAKLPYRYLVKDNSYIQKNLP